MQIIEKPVQKEDWSQDISCPQCLAKLCVSADDVTFIESHIRDDGLQYHRVDDSYAVACAVCNKSLTVSPVWSVQELAKKKHREQMDKKIKAIKMVKRPPLESSPLFSFIWGMLGLGLSVLMSIAFGYLQRNPFF